MEIPGQSRAPRSNHPRDRGTATPNPPLIEGKLHPPAIRTGTVRRDRAMRLLLAAPGPPVVTVVAPAGYGKTVLLADWAACDSRSVAWLTLDDLDNAPSVFLMYVAEAIDRIHPIDPLLARAIVAPGSRILASVVPHLAAELHRIEQPLVLVLDDAHRLTDRTCLDSLAALLDHLPASVQVVIAGRTLPDLPVARMRAAGRLLEIGQADLALDDAETRALAGAAGLTLTADQARSITRQTEGWAAAVYLAALSFGRGGIEAGRIDHVSGRDTYIADYLRTELLDRLDDDDIAFLTRTSVLEIVEAPVAEAVTNLPGAGARLQSLALANRLISELGSAPGSYRYHHLLRDFLEAELERREPGILRELHGRASRWFSEAGRIELAIEHALIGDPEAAARLVVAATLPTLFGGNSDRLDRWLHAFDEASFVRHPPLAAMGAWIYVLSGRPVQAERFAEIADGATFTGDPGDGAASWESSRAMLRGVLARRGPADLLANASLAVAAEPPWSPWRTIALLLLGAANLLSGDEAAADAAFADATDAGAVTGATSAWSIRASLAVDRGDWAVAERYLRTARDLIDRAQFGQMLQSLLAYAVGARVASHHGSPERAKQELVRAQLVRPLASTAAPWLSVLALLELVRAYLALSDIAGARNALAEAEEILRRRDLGVLNDTAAELRARLNVASSTLAGSSALTAAELRLLPMLSTPLTFREIGERVFLSHHTVKTHAISIYGKLQASSRSEAVERAIEIGLLEPFPALARPRHEPEHAPAHITA